MVRINCNYDRIINCNIKVGVAYKKCIKCFHVVLNLMMCSLGYIDFLGGL